MGSEGVSDKHLFHSGVGDAGWATAIAVEAAAGNITGGLWSPGTPTQVTRLLVLVTVAFSYNVQTAEGVVSFFKRVTYGSDTGRVLLGTVRLIDGTAAGVRLYKDINAHLVFPGQQIVAAITVAATGGGAIAGDFLPEVEHMPVPEMPANMKNPAGVVMMVSA